MSVIEGVITGGYGEEILREDYDLGDDFLTVDVCMKLFSKNKKFRLDVRFVFMRFRIFVFSFMV